jgi:DNA-binding transcriptional regulator YdaS (Cro superfamily)
MKQTPLQRAVAHYGSMYKMAKALGVTQPAVTYWVKNNKLPAERVLEVEAATGVSRHDLRPDIYPKAA